MAAADDHILGAAVDPHALVRADTAEIARRAPCAAARAALEKELPVGSRIAISQRKARTRADDDPLLAGPHFAPEALMLADLHRLAARPGPRPPDRPHAGGECVRERTKKNKT